MDKVEPTPVRPAEAWDADAQALLAEHLETEPFLLRISAAKRLRDRAERDARAASEDRVTAARVARLLHELAEGRVA
jgi:chlorophyllide a reductase subunit Z